MKKKPQKKKHLIYKPVLQDLWITNPTKGSLYHLQKRQGRQFASRKVKVTARYYVFLFFFQCQFEDLNDSNISNARNRSRKYKLVNSKISVFYLKNWTNNLKNNGQ